MPGRHTSKRINKTGDIIKRNYITTFLEAAVADVTRALEDMRAGARDAEHYER